MSASSRTRRIGCICRTGELQARGLWRGQYDEEDDDVSAALVSTWREQPRDGFSEEERGWRSASHLHRGALYSVVPRLVLGLMEM